MTEIFSAVIGAVITAIACLLVPPIKKWRRYRNSEIRDVLHVAIDNAYSQLTEGQQEELSRRFGKKDFREQMENDHLKEFLSSAASAALCG